MVGQLKYRGRMPAPDGAATHLRSHDTHACAGADSPSDAVRPYSAAHAGADAPTDVCAQPETYAPTDAAPVASTVESAQPETDPNADAAAHAGPYHAEAVAVAVAAPDAAAVAGTVAGARRSHGSTRLRADAKAYPSADAVADAKADHLAAAYSWADAGAVPEAHGEADASTHADPDAVAHGRAVVQAYAEAHATAEPFADRDGRQPHGRSRVRADAASNAATIIAADNAVAYRLARRPDNESRAPSSRCSDFDADDATVAAAEPRTYAETHPNANGGADAPALRRDGRNLVFWRELGGGPSRTTSLPQDTRHPLGRRRELGASCHSESAAGAALVYAYLYSHDGADGEDAGAGAVSGADGDGSFGTDGCRRLVPGTDGRRRRVRRL